MMNTCQTIRLCLVINVLLLMFIIIVSCTLYDGETKYMRFGPHEDLVLLSIKINTIKKYIFVLIFITIIKSCGVYINDIASPILGFNIYNPDKKEITEFTRYELQFYGNAFWLISGLQQIFLTMVSISQFDIALFSLLISEFTSFIIINQLLDKKTFNKKHVNENEDESNNLITKEVLIAEMV